MSIAFNQKLASTQDDPTIPFLKGLFSKKRQVSISWWGEKMVSFSKDQEAVPIKTLAEKYLQAVRLEQISSFTLNQRYDAAYLLREIMLLYEASNKELEKTRAYKYLVPSLECRLYWGWEDVEARMRGRITTDNLLAFSAETCLKLWPHDSRANSWKQQIAEKSTRKITVTPKMLAQVMGRKGSKVFY